MNDDGDIQEVEIIELDEVRQSNTPEISDKLERIDDALEDASEAVTELMDIVIAVHSKRCLHEITQDGRPVMLETDDLADALDDFRMSLIQQLSITVDDETD